MSQYKEAMQFLSGHPAAILLGDFNHAAYSEIACLVGSYTSPGHFIDATLPRPSDQVSLKNSEWPFRQAPTFGTLYPFFVGSRERRKARRLDLILASAGRFDVTESWTEGDRAIEVERKQPKKKKKGARPDAGKQRRKPKMVKLKCREGLGGYCCEPHALGFASPC